MKSFSDLFYNIENNKKESAIVDSLVVYLNDASEEDKLWTIALLIQKRPKRSVTTKTLRIWSAERSDIPLWLFDETYEIVGDLTETISKVLPLVESKNNFTLSEWLSLIKEIKPLIEEDKKPYILSAWDKLNTDEKFLFNKLLTGGFRFNVSQRIIVNSLAQHLSKDANIVAHKLLSDWDPYSCSFKELFNNHDPKVKLSKPYPFQLAQSLKNKVNSLGKAEEWYAEYKWEGLRVQLIKREGEIYLWSKQQELITHLFPEFNTLKSIDFDFVVDGELLIFKDNKISAFENLQKRLSRKKTTKKTQTEWPIILMAFDLLEINNIDLRQTTLHNRYQKLENSFEVFKLYPIFTLSTLIPFNAWSALDEIYTNSRVQNAGGLILKNINSHYGTNREDSFWYKWKLNPIKIKAVLLYATRSLGRGSRSFTEFTFAVKNGEALIPFTKAAAILPDDELKEIKIFVKQNTKEKFGPVLSLNPELIFEISFQSITESKRHKCGISVRTPEIIEWKKEATISEIASLTELKAYL